MLSAHQLSKSYNIHKILEDVTFSINPGERVGLIGPNGCGKTTLFRILAGEEQPDSGVVSFTPSNLRMGYLPQGFEPPPNLTVKSLIQHAAADPEILEADLVRLATALAENPDQHQIQAEYEAILWQLEQPSVVGRLSSILAALGLDELPGEQLAATLSGGQKTRLSLALVLLSDPQLLLLDEPTNHLDIEMLEWLEDWLNQFRGAALIVSHDRAFLERTVNRILDLNPVTHTLRVFEGGYNDYVDAVTREREKQLQAYNDQIAEIRRMKQDIARTRAQGERTEREASSVRIGGGMMKLKGYKDYQQGIAKKVARKAKSREKKLER
jgi:ATPase subunit of ABC transporter with duplicated ATPase domains